MIFHIPIKLPSLTNLRLHWRQLARIKRQQKEATHLCAYGRTFPPPPLLITITRIGPRKLDGDNLQSACKYVRDAIAAMVGIDDGSDLYTWQYRQQTGNYRVDVEVTER